MTRSKTSGINKKNMLGWCFKIKTKNHDERNPLLAFEAIKMSNISDIYTEYITVHEQWSVNTGE